MKVRLLPPLLLLLVVVGAWDLFVRVFDVPPYLLPSPFGVWQASVEEAGSLAAAAGITGAGAVCGYLVSLLLGSGVAFVFAQSSAIRSGCYPYAIFLQTVPIVAIAPLVVIWFGSGFHSVVIIASIISLFPVITNVTTGLIAVDRGLEELFRLHRASRWQRLRKLQIPNAVPHLLTGAKTSSGLAVVGAIVGEFFVGYGTTQHGLGYIILHSGPQLKTAQLFAATIASAVLGVLMFGLVSFLEHRILQRWYDTPVE